MANIYGTLPAFPNPFNGANTLVTQYNYFNDPEIDQLTGYTLEYTHPFGPINELTASADYTHATSVDYYNDLSFGANQCQIGTAPGGYCYNTSTSLPSRLRPGLPNGAAARSRAVHAEIFRNVRALSERVP